MLASSLLAACGGSGIAGDKTASTGNQSANLPPVQTVLFTHIEDNTPAGVLGSAASRTSYLALRGSLLQMAALTAKYKMRWSLEPDWKFLLAALQYEDAATTSTTRGQNVLRYLRDSMNTAIDAHSHEGGGYNYTDVAHLLDSLGVGGSTVIGGHIWDPALPQFSMWDRFRVPVKGLQYPNAMWRGDILMGSGTPNHVNDPIVSGVWRPKNPIDYFTDDPLGNIACIGAYKGDVATISELVALYSSRTAPATCLLTASIHINPSDITAPGGLTIIENTILKPLATLRDSSRVKVTDFSALVSSWRQEYGGRACTYRLGVVIH
jgi:hypothetical protein